MGKIAGVVDAGTYRPAEKEIDFLAEPERQSRLISVLPDTTTRPRSRRFRRAAISIGALSFVDVVSRTTSTPAP